MGKIKATIVFLISFAAQAEPLDSLSKDHAVCFQHEYSKNELQARPEQTMKMLRLKFSVDENASPNSPQLEVNAKIKRANGKSGTYSALMLCTTQSDQIACAIECDGGSATITWDTPTGTQDVNFNNHGFYLHGGCDDEDELIWLKPTPGGDDVFDLQPVPCPALERKIGTHTISAATYSN